MTEATKPTETAETAVPASREHPALDDVTGTELVAVPTTGNVGRRRLSVGLVLACAWMAGMAILAILADLLPLADPDSVTSASNVRPSFSFDELLGTDNLGRSMLARVVFGGRVSLTVAVCATFVGMVVGTAIGLVAGYFRGPVSAVLDTLTDAVLAFPPLLLLVALAGVLDPSLVNLVLTLGLLSVPLFIRVARANTIAVTQRPFVTAARSLGSGHVRIMAREILPNILLPVSSFALIAAATLVIAEASLSYLGLGIRPPTPSWGQMIYGGRGQLETAPYQVFVPVLMLMLTIFSLNVIGDWARARTGRGASV
jgi:peptide/nickel transport system permease protein